MLRQLVFGFSILDFILYCCNSLLHSVPSISRVLNSEMRANRVQSKSCQTQTKSRFPSLINFNFSGIFSIQPLELVTLIIITAHQFSPTDSFGTINSYHLHFSPSLLPATYHLHARSGLTPFDSCLVKFGFIIY